MIFNFKYVYKNSQENLASNSDLNETLYTYSLYKQMNFENIMTIVT